MISLASTLPNSNTGYVAAAYIVFLAIVLIYVAIMAVRLGRVERKVKELRDANSRDPTRALGTTPGAPSSSPARARAREGERSEQEHETV